MSREGAEAAKGDMGMYDEIGVGGTSGKESEAGPGVEGISSRLRGTVRELRLEGGRTLKTNFVGSSRSSSSSSRGGEVTSIV